MTEQGKLRVMRTARGLSHRNAIRKKIQQVTIERLAFSDHGLLTDNNADFRPGGQLYQSLMGGAHWTAEKSFPTSVTKGTTLSVAVALRIEAADAGRFEGTLVGKPSARGESFLAFEGTFPVGETAPTTLVVLTAKGALPDEVNALTQRTIQWTAKIGAQSFDLGTTGPHDLYVTFDTPNPGGAPMPTPFGPEPAPLEDGITHKRMHAATTITHEMAVQAPKVTDPSTGKPMDPRDPHVITRILTATVAGYTLTPDPSVPKEFGHPHYFNDAPGMAQAGAWPIVDFREQRAECQAIVRYVRAMLMQIGCPGDAQLVVVYAHAAVDEGKTALEDSLLPPDPDASKYRMFSGRMRVAGGLNRNQIRLNVIDGVTTMQSLALADREVKVGELVPQGEVFNSYEACLKFTHGGRTSYYAGGVAGGNFNSPSDVIKVFFGLVWVSQVRSPETGQAMSRVDEIVCKYQ